jgi:hypothetical protein
MLVPCSALCARKGTAWRGIDPSDCWLRSFPRRGGGIAPRRRECIRSASGAVRLIRLLGEGEEGRIRMALVANSGQWTDQDNRLKAAIRGLARKPGETGFGWRLAPARQLGQRPGSPTSTSSGSRTCTNLSPAEPSRVTSTSRS